MTLKISGHSDDIVCVEGDLHDEFYPPVDGAIALEITATDQPRSPGVRVLASYAPDSVAGACWRLAAEPIDEDIPVPWAISLRPEHDYSLALHVESPPGARVKVVRIGKGGDIVPDSEE